MKTTFLAPKIDEIWLKNAYFGGQKSCFHSLKSGLNIIVQKQTARQINPLTKILYILASSITWQPVFMPKKGKEQSVFSRF